VLSHRNRVIDRFQALSICRRATGWGSARVAEI
jgi:hypothetical protein